MRMQDRGLLVDHRALAKIRTRMEKEVQLLQMHLNNAVKFDCNVRSTTDLRYLLHSVLNLPKVKQTKKGAPSTDEDTLLRLSYNSPYAEIFKLILSIRERRTLISGFLGLETKDGRYFAHFLQHGTDSGRLSSRAADKGPQLQNIPKKARSIFIAPPGSVFISADYRRAEAMYVAYDSLDEKTIALFQDETRDLYCEAATETLRRPVAKGSAEREIFKRKTHAYNYGMGPRRFNQVLRENNIDIMSIPGIPGPSAEARCKYLLDHDIRAPFVKAWQSRLEQDIRNTRSLYTALGRRRVFLGDLADEHTFKVGFSYPPQGSINEQNNQGLRRLDTEGWRVVLSLHDSIMLEVPEGDISEASRALSRAMLNEINMHGRLMTIPIDISVGRSWGDMHELSAES